MMIPAPTDRDNSHFLSTAIGRRVPLAKRTPTRQRQAPSALINGADLSFLDDASSITSIAMGDVDMPPQLTTVPLPFAEKNMESALLSDEAEISLILPSGTTPEQPITANGGLLKEQDRALDASKREIFALKLKIYHLEERLRRFAQPAEPLHQQLETQNQKLDAQSQELAALTRRNESLAMENSALTHENLTLTQKFSTLAQERSALAQEKSMLTKEHSILSKEGSKLAAEGETAIRARDTALAALEAERIAHKEAAQRNNHEIEQLRTEVSVRTREAQHQRFLAQAEIEELLGRANGAELKAAALERTLAEQRHEAQQLLERAAEKNNAQEAEVSRLRTQLQQLSTGQQQELAHLSAELEEERSQRARTIEEAVNSHPNVRRQLRTLEIELQRTSGELDFTRAQLDRTRTELQQTILAHQQELTNEKETLRSERDALRMAQESLRAEREVICIQRDAFTSDKSCDRNLLEKQLSEATRALGDAARSYAQSERVREEALRERRIAEAEVQRLSSELHAIREEASHFLGAYSRERSTESAATAALTAERDSLREELQALRHRTEAETASLTRFKAETEAERARLQSGFSAQLTRSMEKLRDCELELLRERATIERYERTMAQERERFAAELRALRAALDSQAKSGEDRHNPAADHNGTTDSSLGPVIDAIVAGLSQRLGGTAIHGETAEALKLVRSENLELMERLRAADLALADQRMVANREHVQLEELILEKQRLQAQFEAQKSLQVDPPKHASNSQLEMQLEAADARIQTLSLKRREDLIRKAISRIERLQAKREALAHQLALFFKGAPIKSLGARRNQHTIPREGHSFLAREGRSFATLAQGALARSRRL
ncbi:hypothetical protein DI09_69p80 [Mitosporidium daphniae]|uniref:Centrosomin N-terminal motif 1 domain-containing protein n=1 Tax=Mitosporidium daphniae TaxID=1485682 RepID=A0A098VNW5_9MICR|nr:uncharacterized protein DI09_69p80 [Mitosporidium daphniae]KGG50484.1 hypothetical protein DI09_69p80 [Mitosporidium daphniae]|eukprot:XP_013236927.1 uncharacterized protein DI09_69p80 [Mitosporidium daphniae]